MTAHSLLTAPPHTQGVILLEGKQERPGSRVSENKRYCSREQVPERVKAGLEWHYQAL